LHIDAVVQYANSTGKISAPKWPAGREPTTARQVSASAGDKRGGGAALSF
jgi:hypothetical protein